MPGSFYGSEILQTHHETPSTNVDLWFSSQTCTFVFLFTSQSQAKWFSFLFFFLKLVLGLDLLIPKLRCYLNSLNFLIKKKRKIIRPSITLAYFSVCNMVFLGYICNVRNYINHL